MRELSASTESDSQVPMEDSQLILSDSQPTNRGTTDSASCGSASVGLTLPVLANKVRTKRQLSEIAVMDETVLRGNMKNSSFHCEK